MQKNASIKHILISLTIILLSLTVSCGSKNNNYFSLYRIIDHLREKNIVESPLINLDNKLPEKIENLYGKWTLLENISKKDYNIWAVSTSSPILASPENYDPKLIQLLYNHKKILYSTASTNKLHWNWLSSNEMIELRKLDMFDRNKNGVILPPNQYIEISKILPDDEITLDLFVTTEAKNQQLEAILSIYANNKLINNLQITNPKFHRIIFSTKLGLYNIKFKNSSNNDSQESNEGKNIIIGMIKFRANKDVILLHVPKSERLKNFPNLIKYKTYYPNNEQKSYALNLYNHIQNNDYINDTSVRNPFSMITRTYINNESMLSIIAPPVTKISIPIKLPNHCILEFGYGFLGETNFKNENAKFTINIKSKYRSQEIFSYTGNPKSLNEFKHKKIYLDKFAGEKIILEFITQSFNIKDNSYKTIPVWINPILYNYKANMNPNVILISIDTLRADHLGCYGYHRNTTPNIDLLSKDSVLFENAYSTTSWTLPAHISLLTSLYTNKHKTYSLLQKIDPKIPLLSNYLRKNQYYTAAITGGGFVGYYYGFAKGFDTFKDFKAAGDLSIRDDEAELLYKLASQWLEENKNKKFFLFLHTYQPHDPYLLPSHIKKAFVNENDKWQEIFFSRLLINKDRYEISFSEQDKENIINLYDSEIRYTDEYFVGPLLKKLKELNLFDNTLIIILSDHGEEFYDHHAWIHGHSLYNELTKIPLIIKFPNNLFKNTRVENPVRLIDIMPTILDYLNLNYKSTKLDGKSLLQIIRHKTSLSRTFFVDLAFDKNNYPSIIGAYTGNYKLIANIEVRSPFVEKILYDNFFVELYDLEKDPLEKNNLAKYQNYNKIINRILPNIQTYISEIKIENATEVKINPELYERLKALGYIR